MTTRSEWLALAARCEAATRPDLEIDAAICILAQYTGSNEKGVVTNIRVDPDFSDDDLCFAVDGSDDCCNRIPELTASIDAIVTLIERKLPGWWWSCGSCHLTGDGDVGALNPRRMKTHANLAPDYNDPLAKGLPAIEGAAEFDEGFCTSLDGRGKHMAALALCVSFCRAKAALAEDASDA